MPMRSWAEILPQNGANRYACCAAMICVINIGIDTLRCKSLVTGKESSIVGYGGAENGCFRYFNFQLSFAPNKCAICIRECL